MTLTNSSTVEANASLFSLFERIWNSLDDILVCFGIFLVFTQVSKSMYGCLRNYFSLSFYVSQAIHYLLLSTIVIFLIGHLVGTETAISFLGGLSIGLGYALQPYIVSLLAGGTLLSMQTIQQGDELRIGEQSSIVEHVGLLYVTTKQDTFRTYFPNAMLAQTPFSVRRPTRL